MLIIKSVFKITLIFCMTASLSCSNLFQGTQNQSSNEAVWIDAQNAFDESQFELAVSKLASLDTDWKAKREVKLLWAQSLAGQCGMTFGSVVDSLAANASEKLFLIFMRIFENKAAQPSKCYEAQLKLEEISTNPGLRTASENLFMVLLGMAKIGVYLRVAFDRDGTNSLGDGDADGGALICDSTEADGADTSGATDKLSALEMRQVITGFGMIVSSFSGAVASLLGSSASLISGLADACDDAGLGGVCTASDPTDTAVLTAPVIEIFRDILSAGSGNAAPLALGIGACTTTIDLDMGTDTSGNGNATDDPDMVSPLCCP